MDGLLPVLHSKVFSLRTKGKIIQACVWSVVLYGSETRAEREKDSAKRVRNDMIMVQWMCNMTLMIESLLTS